MVRQLKKEREQAAKNQEAAIERSKDELATTEKQMDILLDMRLSDQISETEYVSKKHTLVNRKAEYNTFRGRFWQSQYPNFYKYNPKETPLRNQEILDPKKRAQAWYDAGIQMVREGLIDGEHFWGTINCDAVSPKGEICGVTTTSGMAWKIPGRAGDSPILGAGLYVDGEVGAAGSTGRGEANLYNLSSFLIVEEMRRGAHPKDAAITALKRVAKNTIEKRLLNAKGQPNFGLSFYCLNARGDYAGVAMYESTYAVCTEKGPQTLQTDALYEGSATD